MPSLIRPAIALVICALAVAGCSAAPTPTGSTTPSPTPTESVTPVTVEELGGGEQRDGVDVDVDGPTQVVFRRITLAPGAGTGEHCHAGQLVAVVEEGTFTHYAPTYPEGVHVYTDGESIIEGSGYVHQGVNESNEDVVLLVTYVIEEGQPLAQTDLSLCDA